MLDFNSKDEEKKVFSTLTGSWTNNSFLIKILTPIKSIVKFTITKYILSIILVVILGLFYGFNSKDKKLAEDMAKQAANDNIIGVWDQFIKVKKPKISITNSHPLYRSQIVKEWEEENKVKFSKIYSYISFINKEGKKEDLFAMKNKAKGFEEETPSKLELGTTFGDDAEDVCEQYFGEVPTDYQKSFFDRKRHIRIRNIKDELTQENDDGEKFFRCVIDQETIEELLNE